MPPISKWKIYLSSTFKDLKDKRSELIAYFSRQLQDSFELTTIMEQMYDDGSQIEFKIDCVEAVKVCDIYILIIGNKVGSYPPSSSRTYSEIELDTAIQAGKDIFVLRLNQFDESEIGTENIAKHKEIVAKTIGRPQHYFSNVESIKNVFLECLTKYINTSPIDKNNPYKGLSAFDVEDGAYFFGRESSKNDFFKRIIPSNNKSQFISVIGSSGIGKTSFIQAGILYELKNNSDYYFTDYKQIIVTPGGTAFTNLKYELSKQIDITVSDSNHIKFNNPQQKFILFLNQFEEVISQCNTTESQKERDDLFIFLDKLQTTPHLRTLIITTFRSDYLSALSNFNFIKSPVQIYFPLASLDHAINPAPWKDSMKEIITLPAIINGVTIEDKLVDRLLTELKEIDGSLPILQFTLKQLWTDKTIQDRIVSTTEYEEISKSKGIAGIIEEHAENIFTSVTNNSKEKGNICRLIFINLVEVTDNKLDVRKTIEKQELFNKLSGFNSTAVQEVFEELVGEQSRLITVNESSNETHHVDIIHEVLIRKWERLKQWINDRRTSLEAEKEFEHWVRKIQRENSKQRFSTQQIKEIQAFKKSNKDLLLSERVVTLLARSEKGKKRKIYVLSSVFVLVVAVIVYAYPFYKKNTFVEMFKTDGTTRNIWKSTNENLDNVKGLVLDETNYNRVAPNLQYFKNLKSLGIRDIKITDLTSINEEITIDSFSVQIIDSLFQLPKSNWFRHLKYLYIINNSNMPTLKGLDNLLELTDLEIYSNTYFPSLEGLDNLQSLRTLTIREWFDSYTFDKEGKISQQYYKGLKFLENMEKVPSIINLDISGFHFLKTLSGIEKLSLLTSLTISQMSDLESLNGIEDLPIKLLKIDKTVSIDISALYKLKHLEKLIVPDYCKIDKERLKANNKNVTISRLDNSERFD